MWPNIPLIVTNKAEAYLVKETWSGQNVMLTVLREGRRRRIEVTLGERPRES